MYWYLFLVNSLKQCSDIVWQSILCLLFHIIDHYDIYWDIYSYISDISVNYFWIWQYGYFHTNALYIKFFNNFSLPDVASAVIPLLHIISHVVSAGVIVGEDDQPNKLEFVLIDIHGEFTETLHWYCMTKNTLPCYSYHIYLWHVFIYIHIC